MAEAGAAASVTEVLRQQASFSRAVMSSDRAAWRSAAWPEGASHTVKTFSFTRDSCHFLSAEVPSMQPPSLLSPSRLSHTAHSENRKQNNNKKKRIQAQRKVLLPKNVQFTIFHGWRDGRMRRRLL